MFTDEQILSTLKKYWGYDNFRPAQLEIIRSVLAGHNTIGLLPTGGGKSITFQVPTMMTEGLTLVVTPLISLMKDQVDNLRARDIRGVYLHAGLSKHETTLALDRCRLGKAKFLYVSPEKLQSPTFSDQLRYFNITLIVVDEAHCISQWGYDFRPAYLKIADVKKHFPKAPVLALTASATPEVLADISAKLDIDNARIYRLSFCRENISYLVRPTEFKENKIVEILSKVAGTAIVYVRSRLKTSQIAGMLKACGISAENYHAGLHPEEKELKQNRWKSGETRVIVATNAFGMGIDKPDVRLVIHYDMPPSLEEYYQEAGRAGRDGLASFAVLLVNRRDKSLMARRLADAFPPKDTIRRIYELVGNFLEIPMGEGFNRLFEFNIEKFCTTFKFMPAVVVNSLKILTQSGYIDFSEELTTRSRIMMRMDRHELYNVNLPNNAEKVLNYILRTTTGIYADFEYISEYNIALATSLTEEGVYQALLTLSRMQVIHYVPHQKAPYILYTTSRELPSDILIPLEVYERRRDRMAQRIDSMLDFAYNSAQCRENALLRYFGETREEPCGTCDYCREQRRAQRTKSTEQGVPTVTDTILYLASQPGGRSLDYIASQIGGRPDDVIAAIRTLLDTGALHLTGNIVTTAN